MSVTVQTAETEREVTLRTKGDAMIDQAERAVIDGPEAAEKGADLAKWFRVLYKKIDEERTTLVKPLNDHVKMINGRFKGVLDRLEKGQAIIDRKLLDWKRAEEEKARKEAEEAKKRAEEEALARAIELEQAGKLSDAEAVVKEAETAVVPVAKVGTVRGNYGSAASTRKIWKFVVEDLSKVPTEYLEVKSPAVNAAIRNGVRAIPGLRIFEEESLTVR